MLTQQDRDFIEEELVALVAGSASPRAALSAGLGALAARLPDGLAPALLVSQAVEICIEDGHQRTPPAMVTLLQLIKHIAGIPEIIARVSAPPPRAADPFAALILDSKLPFLDRLPTRAHLRALTQQQPTQPVVVIGGGRKSGKSYTSEFVDHLCRNLGGIQHCRIEVPEKQGASIGPAELARDIVTSVGGDPRQEPPANTNLERWTQDLANWIISAAKASGVRWWFVLDGFNQNELRDDTRLLIVKLAKGLTTGMARRLHRLILLDFDRTLLPLQPGMIASESTSGIPASAVAAGVAEVVRVSGKQLDEEKILAKLMEGLSDPVMDLPELGNRFRDLISLVAP
jgi:hypothetical protein